MHPVRAAGPAMTEEIHGRRLLSIVTGTCLAAVRVACCIACLSPVLVCADDNVTDNTGLVAAVEADTLRADVVMALAEQRHADVLASMARYRDLESRGIVVPVSLLFAESESAQALGDWPRAQLALGEFLARADPTDPLYSESLRRYPGIETKVREAAEAREREVALAAASEQKSREEQVKAEAAKYYDGIAADMVSVPAGKLRMGDSTGHGGSDERPLRNVTIAAFKLARHEVTFAQFDRFCAATGCTPPDDNGWGRDDRPVINVSWDDAVAYIDWLNAQSGRKFRLPSEAEWEYAARAGTTTDYWWGATFSPDQGNARSSGGVDQWSGTAPVGQFPANPFGLFDMNGNVREWVQDCWHPDYAGAPVDGQPWQTGDCDRRVLRGGAWNQDPTSLRSADRDWDDRNFRFTDRGFRIAMSE
jgi:formylglycine-generating enzyme required for sulfatase activity